MLPGLMAYRIGKKIEYDDARSRITNSDDGNNLHRR
jgi:hypothetical protein